MMAAGTQSADEKDILMEITVLRRVDRMRLPYQRTYTHFNFIKAPDGPIIGSGGDDGEQGLLISRFSTTIAIIGD